MGLTVVAKIKCPHCTYSDTFSMRHGVGDEGSRPGEGAWKKKCTAELAKEHPNHRAATATDNTRTKRRRPT
jgi:hypothetical protein